MHATKHKTKQTVRAGKSATEHRSAARLATIFKKLSPISLQFVLLWLFATVIYGDVFYMAEQYSLFAYEPTLMRFWLDQPGGWFIVFNRFLLSFFKYPLLGGLIWAVLMTCCTKMLFFFLKKYPGWKIFCLLLPFAYSVLLIHKGLNLYYLSEPSIIFIGPTTVFLCLLVLITIKRVIVRVNKDKDPFLPKAHYIQLISLLIFASATYTYALWYGENVRITARLQRQMQQRSWNEMIETAQAASSPTRPIAAYHAIALSQTGQLLNSLFDIHYQYPSVSLFNRSGTPISGIDMIQHDANFYSGLTYTAYHNSMEQLVIEGPSIDKIKRLFMCALVNQEDNLAHKYLHILRHIPFEDEFCDHYSPLIGHPELFKNNTELKPVCELMPVNDSFELDYRAPLFLGYNICRINGRSFRALDVSMAACLYTKELDRMLERIPAYTGKKLPLSLEQALALMALKYPDLRQQIQFSPLTSGRLNNFIRESSNYLKNKQEGAKYLKKAYGDFYPYYYFYENLPTPEDIAATHQNSEKGGVN